MSSDLFISLVLASLAPTVSAQVERVNRPLNSPFNGEDVTELQIAPGGNEVLYRVTWNGYASQFRVPLAGGATVDLPSWPPVVSADGNLAVRVSVQGGLFWFVSVWLHRLDRGTSTLLAETSGFDGNPQALVTFSPDGEWVALVIEDDSVQVIPTEGDAPDPIVLGPVDGFPRAMAFSPDGARLVYLADGAGDDLFSVPIDGSSPPVILDNLDTTLSSFAITSDGARVVWRGTRGSSGFHLSSCPLDGSRGAVTLSGASFPGREVRDYRLSPDGRWVVYRGDMLVDGRLELFRAPVDGSSAPVRLSGNLVSGGNVEADFALDATGTNLVFRADARVDGRFELFTVPTDGSRAPLRVNPALVPGGDVLDFQLPASGHRLCYRADQEEDERIELYSAPIDASAAPARLSGSPLAESDVAQDYDIGPGGVVVYFRQDRDQDERFQLFGRAMSGAGTQVELGGPLGAESDVVALVAGTGGRVAYIADERRAQLFELFSVNLAGVRTRLSDELEAFGSVGWNRFCSQGERMLYVSSRDRGLAELHGAALDGVPDFVKLHPPLQAGQTLTPLQVTRDGSWVLFDISGARYSARSEGHTPPVPLPLTGAFIDDTSLDSRRVLFHTSAGLFSTLLDGSASPVRLSEALPAGTFILFSAQGGNRVLFVVRALSGTAPDELWSAPVDGSQPAVLLATKSRSSEVQALPLISPDGTQAAFFDDRDADGGFELYGVPTDASRAAVRLHDLPVHASSVKRCKFASDSRRVVLLADLETDQNFELFRAPIDGSLPAAKLPLPAGSILDFVLSPDSLRVVVVGALETPGMLELFSVPIDGSQPAAKLNAPLPPGGDISSDKPIRITADSSSVLFVAQNQLYRAPIAGGSPPVKLSLNYFNGIIDSFDVSSDGRWAAYLRNGGLFVVPTDGSLLPERVNRDGSGSLQFQFSPDSRRITFLWDAERRGRTELYQFRLSHQVQRTR